MSGSVPLVTVICLCYNHAQYVGDAIESVIAQTYKSVQLIVVNDASKDDSFAVINAYSQKYPQICVLHNQENIGMCRSFNKALSVASGDFIIDLAADDVLMPNKVEKQIAEFGKLGKEWGIVFTNANIVNALGKDNRTFYGKNHNSSSTPVGNVFTKVVKLHCISAATMMVRRDVFDTLGGYDEKLCYEDFDFFVRASRFYKFSFLNEITIVKREVIGSDSQSWYKRKNNPHLQSTLIVLKKYLWLCRSQDERLAALHLIRYHMRQALFMECFSLVEEYYELLRILNKIKFHDRVILSLAKMSIPLHKIYSFYRKRRFG